MTTARLHMMNVATAKQCRLLELDALIMKRRSIAVGILSQGIVRPGKERRGRYMTLVVTVGAGLSHPSQFRIQR
jgi:hypothetical protein